jgi:ATPase subunit of ABC transporter with duplicated ATPase domains
MILAKNIFYSYGNNFIFKDASFFVAKNSKVGLVGANGAGKSTLFKLLTKEELKNLLLEFRESSNKDRDDLIKKLVNEALQYYEKMDTKRHEELERIVKEIRSK